MHIEDFLGRLEGVTKSANGFQAKCPAHDDNKASLCIHTESDGKILIKCQAGCETPPILGAVGLRLADLFPEQAKYEKKAQKAKPVNFNVVAEYTYNNEEGELLYQVCRLDPKDFLLRQKVISPTSAGWEWKANGIRRVLYRLPEVLKAIAEGKTIFVCEGEKDVHTIESMGLVATTNPIGAAKWLSGYTKSLKGADVVIVPDNDGPGRKHAHLVAVSIIGDASRVRVLTLPGLPPKGDVSDWKAAGGTQAEFLTLLGSVQDWKPTDIELDPPKVSGSDGEMLNDLGNARRLVKKFGENIRYCCDSALWYRWDGEYWKNDSNGAIMRMARVIVDEMVASAAQDLEKALIENDDDLLGAARAFERHAITSGNNRRMTSMIEQARADSKIIIMHDELDKDNYLLNCANGTIDLRTSTLRPHARENMITKRSPVAYEPKAKCPAWLKFLDEIFKGDEEILEFIHCACGYTLTGETREQVFFIMYGCGSNGKTTFITALRNILDGYHMKISTDTLVEKNSAGGATNDIAMLGGARFVSAIETSAGKKLAESLVKELTGQDQISARFLYKEFFTFTPVFKLWLACNHVPIIQGQDNGIWRRIRLVPFLQRYEVVGHPTGPYMDKTLEGKLAKEYEGILAWLVRGCQMWLSKGLPVCNAITAATGKVQQNMDILNGFLTECTVWSSSAEITAKALYETYCAWATANGEKALSQKWFGMRLTERGNCERVHDRNGFTWHGIGLVTNRYIDSRDGCVTDRDGYEEQKGGSQDPDSCLNIGSVTDVTDVTEDMGNPHAQAHRRTGAHAQGKFTENASHQSHQSRTHEIPSNVETKPVATPEAIDELTKLIDEKIASSTLPILLEQGTTIVDFAKYAATESRDALSNSKKVSRPAIERLNKLRIDV